MGDYYLLKPGYGGFDFSTPGQARLTARIFHAGEPTVEWDLELVLTDFLSCADHGFDAIPDEVFLEQCRISLKVEECWECARTAYGGYLLCILFFLFCFFLLRNAPCCE